LAAAEARIQGREKELDELSQKLRREHDDLESQRRRSKEQGVELESRARAIE